MGFKDNVSLVGQSILAYVSDHLLGRLAADQVVELSVDDWHSGRNIWLMDMVASFGHGRAIANDLRRNIFAPTIFHSMRRYPGVRSKYTRWRGSAVPSSKQAGR